MSRKKALITGVTGQDGSYLAEFLLDAGYDVHGVARRTSLLSRSRIDRARAGARRQGKVFELQYGDMGDSSSLNRILTLVRPDEVYNLAAQSHVGVSFQQPEYTSDVNATGVLRLMEGIRSLKLETRFYQASTSEMFGQAEEVPQTESTPFHPRSPYAVAKMYGYWIVRNYREAYGMHASNGILFNHESPRRGENFVTRKITLGLARVHAGADERVSLGNLDAERDWGAAEDFVEAIWKMLQQERPDDYVVATGESHSVRQFAQLAAEVAGFDVDWEGSGEEEVGRDRGTGRILFDVDSRYYRPAEVESLVGDASKASEVLGWRPRIGFEELVERMMKADLEAESPRKG
ncbi:MAG: GDP-mannose 4,6-dehydratase [Planctomycetota bacterium]